MKKVMNKQDRIFYTVCNVTVTALMLLVLYPMIYIVSASFSSGTALTQGKVWLWPVDVTLDGYKAVLQNKNVWLGYRNTIFYTVFGTVINLCMTMFCAYPLARKRLRGRGIVMFLFTFTMIFGGGMIPSYILMKNLHLLNSVWVILLPGAISVYNMIVARTYIQSNIPDELLEATQIDGCNDVHFFFKMVLPLSKAVIAVLALWYAVGHWNAYFNAFLYLTDKKLYPLQIFLRDILIQNQGSADMMDGDLARQMLTLRMLLKYAVIVVTTAPLYVFYPFAQKYFIKGVMIGSIKG